MKLRTVTKIFIFDAAHRLYRYEGKCSNMHGHTYKAEVELTADKLDNMDLLVDFGEIKKRIGRWIDEEWDHVTLLNSEDPLWFERSIEFGKVYVFNHRNPTAEVMAEELWEIVDDEFPRQVVSIKIWETPTSFATYNPGVRDEEISSK